MPSVATAGLSKCRRLQVGFLAPTPPPPPPLLRVCEKCLSEAVVLSCRNIWFALLRSGGVAFLVRDVPSSLIALGQFWSELAEESYL